MAVHANSFEIEESEFSEKNASLKKFWGTLREKALAENILSAMPKAESVLDIGAGDGYLCYLASKEKKCFVAGLDIAKKRLKNAKKNFPGFLGVRGSALRLPFKSSSIDVVVCSQLLEHLPKWRSALKELYRVSKKSVIITVPYRQFLILELCPKCKKTHFLSGHINSFDETTIAKAAARLNGARIKKLFGFHTIFSYNKATMKLPKRLRLFFDKTVISARALLSFFKPNYLLARIDKH